ncbi:MAG: Smr/MutS family protein [Candidatus Eremiobacteraeota bacterium]|nr:Smr/MutS family protein [Candidatus Eremiobacteraeota bacterium]
MANTLGYLDAILALARYAVEAGANLPEVKNDCALRLVNARHPLLGRDCVPISVEVGDGFSTLVITGPNTGGKTVGLKTVGLLAVMALCGMPIPASSGTTVPLLTGVWADIGDEQSIAQSLSTFSAHLTQILRILPESGPGTLVLLDELGAGTDPAEGSALGIALLDYLNARGGLTVLTTHLSQLKVHAAQTPGFQNAAVEFDAASLSPTYRILMGIPGRSNALAIADRLGLPREVLRRAREHLGQDHAGVEGLLDDLEHERDAVRALEGRLEVENRELSELRRAYEEKMRAARDERERLLAEASVEAGRMVEEARKKVTGLLQDFRTRMKALGQARRDALEQARQLSEELAQRVEPPAEPSPEELEAPLEETEEEGFDEQFATTETPAEPEPPEDVVDEVARREARQVEAALAELDDSFAAYRPAPKPVDESAPLPAGTAVYARRYGQDGEVLSQKGERVEVRLGAVRMTVDRDDLEVIEARREATQIRLPESGRDKVSTRVDLRGLTVDEALFELDRYLDAAAMARADKLEVIHGKGTGALRNAVQSHLRQHTLVADYRLGEVHEGGWGVTVVKMRL